MQPTTRISLRRLLAAPISVGQLLAVLVAVGALTAVISIATTTPSTAAPVQPVLVTNSTSKPVPTRQAASPFQRTLRTDFAADQLGASVTFTVPAGKQLTIEYASMNAMIDNGLVTTFGLSTTAGGERADHLLTVTSQGAAGGFGESFIGAQAVRIYADPGTTVTLGAGRQVGGRGVFVASISGTLVKTP